MSNPDWSEVYTVWCKHDVPEIEFIEYIENSKMRAYELPWYNKRVKSQVFGSNPINDTAMIIGHEVLQNNKEAMAAFKIHAYFWDIGMRSREGVSGLSWDLLHQYGYENGDLWEHNAGTVMPGYDYDGHTDIDQPWQYYVDRAANAWSSVAEKFSIVRLKDIGEELMKRMPVT